jgi:hypothetical protein
MKYIKGGLDKGTYPTQQDADEMMKERCQWLVMITAVVVESKIRYRATTGRARGIRGLTPLSEFARDGWTRKRLAI